MIKRTACLCLLFCTQIYANPTFGPVFEKGARINPNETRLSASDSEQRGAIVEQYSGTPGCYIMCVGPRGGLYSLGSTYDFHGLIRINGSYPTQTPTNSRSKRYCYPSQLGDQASYFTLYKDLCDQTFPKCNKLCNGNGDTGGFFTSPPIR